jgi:hypothetical protein
MNNVSQKALLPPDDFGARTAVEVGSVRKREAITREAGGIRTCIGRLQSGQLMTLPANSSPTSIGFKQCEHSIIIGKEARQLQSLKGVRARAHGKPLC